MRISRPSTAAAGGPFCERFPLLPFHSSRLITQLSLEFLFSPQHTSVGIGRNVMKTLAALVVSGFLAATSASAEIIRIATWNINNLNDKSGVALRDRAPIREDNDYILLQKYAAELGADVIALQEMGNPAALRRVFPESEWDMVFESRYKPGNDPDIFTAVVVKKGRARIVEGKDYEPLGVINPGDGRPVRRGIQVLVEADEKRFWLLGVHLKSACFAKSLTQPVSDDCKTLAMQMKPLEDWIDEKEATGLPVVIAGDFNRKFDVHGQNDHLWAEIDDADPASLDLIRTPFREASRCPTTRESDRPEPIDFIVTNKLATEAIIDQSFVELLYDETEAAELGNRLSDHCPKSIDFKF
ncbi:endonuclease/exonuclease/phosphatase family protein [Ensifer aridi]|uniref:endonuclease/exonuclease/phosphatase family protein n=1 Tax=Ensifer aridi TaxID=1708715 RepID=UPI00111C46B4|nr:endonuclease/exonuclease/phosphatase family protein [Ensifer aridi]